MKRNHALASRLREVFLNGTWIANTNYRDQLQNIDWQQATQKIENLNTIALLTYHVNYYLQGLLKAFETGKLEMSDQYSFDLPPIQSASDWNHLVTNFLRHAELFADKIENMDDEVFDQVFIDPRYGTYLRNIEGVIEHSYYHLGQMAMIKKLLTQIENTIK